MSKMPSSDVAAFAGKNTSVEINYVQVASNVSIRCISFTPCVPKKYPTVLFVPGWISQLNSWRYFLPKVTSELHMIYVETREKTTSRIHGKASFSIDAISDDITKVIDHFGLGDNEYILAGSSLGATSILHSFTKLPSVPLGMVLILPNSTFPLPRYTPIILKLVPPPLLPAVRELVKWVMLKTKINPDDNEHQKRFIAALNAADAIKLRDSALAVYSYRLDLKKLRQIQIPCLVIGASKDGEHNQNDIREIANNLALAEYLDLTTFAATHSTKGAVVLLSYVAQLYRRGK